MERWNDIRYLLEDISGLSRNHDNIFALNKLCIPKVLSPGKLIAYSNDSRRVSNPLSLDYTAFVTALTGTFRILPLK